MREKKQKEKKLRKNGREREERGRNRERMREKGKKEKETERKRRRRKKERKGKKEGIVAHGASLSKTAVERYYSKGRVWLRFLLFRGDSPLVTDSVWPDGD